MIIPDSVKTEDNKYMVISNGLRIFCAIKDINGEQTTADYTVHPFSGHDE